MSFLRRMFEGLVGGGGLDEILAQLGEDDLVAEKLGGLIVDHQDVDFLVWPVIDRPPDCPIADPSS